MGKVIDSTKYYDIIDEQHLCCSELQFRYICKEHRNRMECYFCTFDPDEACQC